MMKVDLHLHSRASSKAAGYFSERLGIRECYVSPADIHATLVQRGMTLFTISDHDTIDGVLEIADRPGVFLSEEITTWFPEDKSKVHVLAWDITEAQHREIQAVRENIYDLADYLQEAGIPHALAHPLYDMSGRFTTSHIERFLLLFDVWESINGTRSTVSSELCVRMAQECTPKKLERLANRWGFNKRTRVAISFTAGTDDHSGFDIGKSWTEAEGTTVADLRRAIFAGTTQPCGQHGSPVRLANTIISNAVHTLDERAGIAPAPLKWLFQTLRQPGATPATEFANAPAFVQQTLAGYVGADGGADDPHKAILDFFNNAVPTRIGELLASGNLDVNAITRTIGEGVISLLPMLTYLGTFWHRGIDKQHARDLGKKMGVHPKLSGKVAYLTDTFDDLNGVARTSQAIWNLCKEEQLDIDVLLCDPVRASGPSGDHMMVFEPILSLPVPQYPELSLHLPNIVRLVEHCEREDYQVIYAATPGPMGLCGLLVARLLGLPYVTTFHTDFVEYTEKYTHDHLFVGHVSKALRFFCNCADRVLAPSYHTAATLIERGVDEHRIEVFARGVDGQRFNPSRRDPLFWARFDPTWDGERIVLYAGRVAVEKGLDVFSAVAAQLAHDPNVRFAVVGDGPWLDEMRKQHGSRMIFTGYLEGDQLATAYASADVFLFPSETETFGNVILEAQAAGLPCLVAGKGASRENLLPDVTGWVIEENDASEYTARIASLLRDEPRLTQMSLAARAHGSSRDRRALLLEMIRLLSLDVVRPSVAAAADAGVMPVAV
ncbi:MAG: glycosyltransferase [Planctomycetota bacterium]